MKKCVYTCITGNYDSLKNIKYVDKEFDYICFTNNKDIKSDFWNIKYVEEKLEDVKLSKKIKILSYKYLPNYDLTVWIDGTIELLQPISKFINEQCEINKYDMIVFNHSQRKCIYEELNACVLANKETIKNADRIKKFLIKENYPKNNGLTENGVLVRKNVRSINALMEKWYSLLDCYSNRDQLTFCYALYKNPVKIKRLNLNVMENNYFHNSFHNNIKNGIMFYFGTFVDLDYHNIKYLTYDGDKLKKGLKITVPRDVNQIEIALEPSNLKLNNIVIDNKKIKFKFHNIIYIENQKYFFGQPRITLTGNMKKGEVFNIQIDVSEVSYKKLTELYCKVINDNFISKDKIKNLENEKNKIKQEKTDITKNYDNLKDAYDNILNSKSWKITKPIRWLTNILKK